MQTTVDTNANTAVEGIGEVAAEIRSGLAQTLKTALESVAELASDIDTSFA